MNATICYGHDCDRKNDCLLYRGWRVAVPRIIEPDPEACEHYALIGETPVRHTEDYAIEASEDWWLR